MRFSSSLRFNAVAEWWEEYLSYETLKDQIYTLEKQTAPSLPSSGPQFDADLEANEQTLLFPSSPPSPSDNVFVPMLDKELRKVSIFYETQERAILDELEDLEAQVKEQELKGMQDRYEDDWDSAEDDDAESTMANSRDALSHSNSESAPPPKRRRRISSSASRAARTASSIGRSGRIPEDSPVEEYTQRYSFSSTSDNELEDSIASLSKPQGTMRRIATTLRLVKDHAEASPLEPTSIWNARGNYAFDTRLLFKRRITTLYVSVSNLRSYVEVNSSGFRKILKKYDKITYSDLKDRYMHTRVETALPFTQASRDNINAALDRLIDLYAKCVEMGDRNRAKTQLKLYQRENIALERDTVWRTMIGRERKGDNALGITVMKDEKAAVQLGGWRITWKQIYLLLAVAIFVTLANVQAIDAGVEANKCFAILVFCTILWATEAIPLFVTSLLVPLLLVTLQVIRAPTGEPDEYEHLPPKAATGFVFSIMFSPTIMLLIGGFTISSALSKTNIDRILITRVLSLAGTRPNIVLLAFMGVSCFASMWISNVAAPTLCFTLIRPILRTLPPKAPFGPALVLGIALAANIGGQSSPISSPQNLIALKEMDPPIGWGTWFAVALPVSTVSILLIWGLLVGSYGPTRIPGKDGDALEIKAIRPTAEPFSMKQWFVSIVCLLTIALWCVEHQIEDVVGDMGVIAIFPIIMFFGSGVLKKNDFEQFAWTIVFLAMGGIALGKGVTSSGLLNVMDDGVRHMVGNSGLYTVVIILSVVVLIVSTFISHTIASVLLVPIAKEVAMHLDGQPKNLLIFITALICSTGMGMPVSGFPNQTAATQENDLGELYLSNVDFLVNGVPASIIATLVVSTLGFVLMKAVGV